MTWLRSLSVSDKGIILTRDCQTFKREPFLHTLLAPALGNANDQMGFPTRYSEHCEVAGAAQDRWHWGLGDTFSWHISLAN